MEHAISAKNNNKKKNTMEYKTQTKTNKFSFFQINKIDAKKKEKSAELRPVWIRQAFIILLSIVLLRKQFIELTSTKDGNSDKKEHRREHDHHHHHRHNR